MKTSSTRFKQNLQNRKLDRQLEGKRVSLQISYMLYNGCFSQTDRAEKSANMISLMHFYLILTNAELPLGAEINFNNQTERWQKS